MIYATRTVKISRMSNFQPAVEWGVKLAAYLNEKFGTDYQCLHRISGEGLQLHWVATYDSLAVMEEHVTARNSDEGYAGFLAEMLEQELFAGWEDHLFRALA
jgi:hypothetical protein